MTQVESSSNKVHNAICRGDAFATSSLLRRWGELTWKDTISNEDVGIRTGMVKDLQKEKIREFWRGWMKGD